MSATPPPPLSAEEEAVMRALGRLMLVLPRALNSDLERDQRMTASEYHVLRHLSESPCGRMRMSELAQACDKSQAGMTRLTAKLEQQGHLRRTKCDSDARGWNAELTDKGLTRLREAWPTHLASVRRHIFDHLTGLDLAKLAKALDTITSEK
jgi:DNA-binding MarR family transcriptional regulator